MRTKPAALLLIAALLALLAACGSDDEASTAAADKNDADGELHARPLATYAYAAQMFPDEAPAPGDASNPRHVYIGQAQYDTDPPTSGPHYAQLVLPGVQDMPVADEVLVHNMEHGYVIVWYNCGYEPALSQDACADLRNQLSALVVPRAAQNAHVVLAPDGTMERRIALTAWQFMDAFDGFDQARVQAFIDTFECHYDVEGTCDA